MITKITPPAPQQPQRPTTGSLPLPIDMPRIIQEGVSNMRLFWYNIPGINREIGIEIHRPNRLSLRGLIREDTHLLVDKYDEQGNHTFVTIDQLAELKFRQLRGQIEEELLSFDQLSEEAQDEFMDLFKRAYASAAFSELYQTKTILEEGISSRKYGINATVIADKKAVVVSRYFAEELEKVFDGNREQAAKAIKHLMSLNKKLEEQGKSVTVPKESGLVTKIFRDTHHKPVLSDISSVIVELLINSTIDNNSSNTVKDFFNTLFSDIETLDLQATPQPEDITQFMERIQGYSNEVHKLGTPPLVLPDVSMNLNFLTFMERENLGNLTRTRNLRNTPTTGVTTTGDSSTVGRTIERSPSV